MANSNSTGLSIVHVYMVDGDKIAIQIQEGSLTKGWQETYVRQAGDQIYDRSVFRNGQYYGHLVDVEKGIIRTTDQYTGQPLDLAIAKTPQNYRLTANSNGQQLTPSAIFHKSKLTELGQVGPWEFKSPTLHTLYLDLPKDLTVGETYTIDLANPELGTVQFTYQPEALRSEAVQVSQLGFDPDDPAKVAFLSTWMGANAPLSYEVGTRFWLVDTVTGDRVYQGTVELSKARNQAEDNRGRNYNGTDIYLMNFSDFNRPGSYRVLVDGVGTSFDFEIGEKTWEEAFYTSVRGLYHQRSGIALQKPYTDYERPRAFHPADGVVVYQSTAKLMDVDMGLNLANQSAFTALTEGITNQTLPNAWGGWFDAGDWDRRIQHLEVPRALFELASSNPAYFAQLNLNLPESNNALPDIIDEALWGLDFFRRLQTPEGGVRGGVESAEHPKPFEASWQESLTVMAYAPDIWSSYLYAGVAARAAYFLQTLDANLAQTYRESALKAMNWAEKEYAAGVANNVVEVNNERNLAAVELYQLTGDARWHKLFLDTTIFQQPGVEIFQTDTTRGHENSAWVYTQIKDRPVDQRVQDNARAALLKEADTQINALNRTAYKWYKHPWAPLGWGESMGAPDAETLIRAHRLTGDDKYLKAVVLATQFAAGANPDNLVYTTGLGHRSPQDPLIVDVRATGGDPPPGITVYGPMDVPTYGNYWAFDLFYETMSPYASQWPTTEGYFDAYFYVPVTEYTVYQTIAPTAFTWGYLAAVDEVGGEAPPQDPVNPVNPINPVDPSPAPLPTGDRLLRWQLDEGNGAIARDSSGNNRTGSLQNGPLWTPGKVGTALAFDGQNDLVVDDRAENYLNGQDALTIALWVKSDQINSDRGVLATTAFQGNDQNLGIRYDAVGARGGGRNVLKLGLRTTAGFTEYESASNLQTTDWQHLTLTWKSGEALKLYVNGELDRPTAPGNILGGTITGVTDLFLGRGQRVAESWDGLIDDLQIFDRSLSAAEVKALMGTPTNPNTPTNPSTPGEGDRLVQWGLNEGSGTRANDASGNNRNGTLLNGPTWTPGKVGTALAFDGRDDLVVDSRAEDYLTGLDEITISTWVKSDQINSDRGILATTAFQGNDQNLGIRYDAVGARGGGRNVLKLGLRTTAGFTEYESASNLQTTDWQHLTLTWKSGEALKLYVNGELDRPTAPGNAIGGTLAGITDLFLGRGQRVAESWDGLIDEFRIYDRAFSAAEVKALATPPLI